MRARGFGHGPSCYTHRPAGHVVDVSAIEGESGTISAVRDVTPVRLSREQRFRELYAASADDLIRFLQRRVAAAHVEDVAAKAYLTVWRRIDELPRDLSDARAWVFGIARRCALNALRSSDRQDALAVRIADQPSLTIVTDTHAIDTRLDLAAAWRRLDPGDQEVLALTAFEDLTSAEAGAVLDISPAAYRVRLMRARRSLRALLDKEIPS